VRRFGCSPKHSQRAVRCVTAKWSSLVLSLKCFRLDWSTTHKSLCLSNSSHSGLNYILKKHEGTFICWDVHTIFHIPFKHIFLLHLRFSQSWLRRVLSFGDITPYRILLATWVVSGASGSVVVQILWYKPEGRGLRPDEVNEFIQFT
jgi:hypothetical protein